jgi:hypothetical protein
MVLIGEEVGDGTAMRTDTLGAPMTFATMESALNWLLESPNTRDLRVTGVSRGRPVRHVIGHFTLDSNLAESANAPEGRDDRVALGPPTPSPPPA